MLNFFKSALVTIGRSLPARARRSLFNFGYQCAPDEFVKFGYLYGNGDQSYALQQISFRGFSPRMIVDVGAYQGQWSTMVKSIWPASRIFMIEPNPEHTQRLQSLASQLDGTLYTELLGAEEGKEVQFHLMGSGSSVLSEQSDVPRTIQTRRLRTLNALFAGGDDVDLLKIDAQGYELQILAGADRLLSKVKGVILEISLIEVNQGCPLLHEVIAYMREREFVAYDILEMHRRPLDNALFQIDVFFCREDAPLRADKRFS